MRLIRTKYFLYATLLFTITLSTGCNLLTKKGMPGGVDFNSLNVQEPKLVKTFETAKKNDKKVLLIFDATWCGSCRKFNQKTMKDTEVQETLAKDFEVLNIDVDKYPEVIKAFQNGSENKRINAIPAILIFSSDGSQTDQIIGYSKPEKFNKVLKQNL